MSINKVFISGNLTRDPELRATPNGTNVLSFGVAVNDRRKNPQTGEWEDVPNFVDCIVFGNRAEPLSRYLSKGMKVAIEGKLRWSQWEKDGQKRSKIEVICDEVELMQRQGAQQPESAPRPAPRQQAPTQTQYAPQNGSQGLTAQQAAALRAVNAQPVQAPQPDLYSADIPF